MTRLRSASVILLGSTVIAGCGGSASDVPAPKAPAQSAPATAPAPAPGGGLRVAPVDLRVGDATVADNGGLRELPNTRVPAPPISQQGVGAGSSCENVDVVPSESNLQTVKASTLCLLNGERSDAGLKALSRNPQLARAAAAHSEEMVAKQFFDHTGANGSDPVDRIRSTGYIPTSGTWTVGENLAWGTGTLATPKAIVVAWMKSRGHRENILRPAFREIGFGVVAGNPRDRNGSGATFSTAFGAVSDTASRVASRKGKARAARRTRRARIAAHR